MSKSNRPPSEPFATPVSTDADDRSSVSIGLFGIKLQHQPCEAAQPDPKTWTEVLRRTKGHLFVLVDSVVGFVPEACKSTVKIVKGIGNWFVRDRIERAEELAFRDEDEREAQAIAQRNEARGEHPHSPEAIELVRTQLVELIQELRDRGIAIRVDQLSDGQVLFSAVEPALYEDVVDRAERAIRDQREANLQMSIAQLGLSTRCVNLLIREDISTVAQLVDWSANELLTLINFGEAALDEVRRALAAFGFALRGERVE